MPQALDFQTTTTTPVEQSYIFVLQLVDGRIAIGQAPNVALAIATSNSGMHPSLPKPHAVKSVLGVKPVDAGRTFVGTVSHFCQKYGEDKVVAL